MKKRKKSRRIFRIFLLLIIALLAWSVWGTLSPQITNVTITSGDLPQSFDGFKIAQISDLHNAEFGQENKKLIELLTQADPDIIALTGDIVDSHRPDVDVALAFVRQAVEIAPCYFVTGNHEWLIPEAERQRFLTGLEDAGVIVLEDEEAIIEKGVEKISLIGIDDPIADNAIALNMNSEELRALNTLGGFSVLLSHRPEPFDKYVGSGINLVLSGHAHGGQVRLPFIGGLYVPTQGWLPEYDAGVYSKDGTDMVVSRGIGNSLFPLRFNNRPEIVIIELKAEK